ncbi:MAG: AAA family ATPase [Clostridia bacterium]|nr:AAA family ATPase [Clostridia bacterium]
MSLVLATTSGKGGTGKSTVSVSLALAFSKLNKKVLLMDMDEGLRSLDLFLSLDDRIVFDLSDVLKGADIEDAVYPVDKNENISLLPAPRSTGEIEPDAFKELLGRLVPLYDVVILDFPAGLDFYLYNVLPKDTQFITVCNPDPVSVRDAGIVCDLLPHTEKDPRLILNRFDIELIKNGTYKNIDDIIDASGLRLLGVVPNDSELMLLSVNHKLHPKKRAFKAATRIAKRLLGEKILLPKPKKI